MSDEKLANVVEEDKKESSNDDEVTEESDIRKEGKVNDTELKTKTVAGIKRPAESQEINESCTKSAFKFRPATLQSGQFEKSYTNVHSQSESSVSSSGFVLQPSKLSAQNNSGGLFKRDSSRPNLMLGVTVNPVLSLSPSTLSNKPDSSTSDKKNIFLEFLSTSKSPSASSSTGNFLFGTNLEKRVTLNSDKTNAEGVTESETDGGDKDGVSTNSTSVVFGNSSVPDALPEIERITGEEKEENVLQISAKLYVFNSVSHSWKERGRGELHLNDSHQALSPTTQSRIVMRCSGTYKVLLNTYVWAQMMCELADRKSVRISAQDADCKVKVFLIVSNPKHTVSLHNALLKRIMQLANLPKAQELTSDVESPS